MLTLKNSVVTILSLFFSFYLISMKTSSVPMPSMRMALGDLLVNFSYLYLSKCVQFWYQHQVPASGTQSKVTLFLRGYSAMSGNICGCHSRASGCDWNANKQLTIYRTVPTTKNYPVQNGNSDEFVNPF